MSADDANGNGPATGLMSDIGLGPSSISDLMIVGIGASAGGLEAFRQLLPSLAVPSGMALVLLQHHSPSFESAFSYVLQEISTASVAEITDDMSVEGGRVYVAPPNCAVVLREGHFHLESHVSDAARFSPIDLFFASLAEQAGKNAVAIVLSGAGSDGAKGVHAVKAAGGVVLVQDPDTAKNDAMPKAAIATGKCDLVLSPNEIAEELQLLSQRRSSRAIIPERLQDALIIGPQHYEKIFVLLRKACGIDFGQYKLPTVQRRIRRRMAMHKVVSVDHYLAFLQDNPQEVAKLHQDILIHVTQFFREPESFDALAQEVFPALLQERSADAPLRFWVPGCSTGEEPYSLAMAFAEFLDQRSRAVPVQIYATDVSENALSRARAGIYAATIVDEVPPERLQRFFTKVDEEYRVNKAIRELCIFAQQDLTRDPPLAKPDLIVCRNVLIYFGLSVQSRLLHVFHHALKPDGFLMLGSAETIGHYSDLFDLIDARFHIYRKRKSDTTVDGHLSLPLRTTLPAPVDRPAEGPQGTATMEVEATRLLLDRYSPPTVVVNEELRIVKSWGKINAFLERTEGPASQDLFNSCREGVLPSLRAALQNARKSNSPVQRRGLRVRTAEGLLEADLEVVPFGLPGEGRHYLIVFQNHRGQEPVTGAKPPAKAKKPTTFQEAESMLERLREELSTSREYMQSIIQDLEAVNEELQSANQEILLSNEEVRSANDALDAAKEELQCTNEQLNAVNEELHGRNEELVRMNSDLVNVLNSVQMALVILDRNGKIRRFTAMAESVLNLVPGDIGRPFGRIKSELNCPELERRLVDVVNNVPVPPRKIQDRQGRRFSLEMRPYRSMDDRIDGVVLAFLPVDENKRYESEAKMGESNPVVS